MQKAHFVIYARDTESSPWRLAETLPDDYEITAAEERYNILRNTNPSMPLRLVRVSEHVLRSGQGQVHE
jgi:hypothetical protein